MVVGEKIIFCFEGLCLFAIKATVVIGRDAPPRRVQSFEQLERNLGQKIKALKKASMQIASHFSQVYTYSSHHHLGGSKNRTKMLFDHSLLRFILRCAWLVEPP